MIRSFAICLEIAYELLVPRDLEQLLDYGRSQEMCNVEAQHLFSAKITCFSYFFLRKTRGNTILEKITLKPGLPGVRLDTPLASITFLPNFGLRNEIIIKLT